MRTKRINTELYDTITVTDKSGNAIDFSNAYDINLYLQKQGSSSLLKQDFALNGNTLSYQFNSDENNRGLGTYDLHLEWKKKDANSELTYDQYHFDYLGCFKIVRSSDEENWSEGVSGTVLQFGADGLSAYEVAVKNGYVGTITEWLLTLKADVTKENVEAVLTGDITSHNHATQIATALADYVKAVAGKGLSTNDLTDALLTKLNGLSNYDDTTLKGNVSSLQTQMNTLLSANASTAIESFNEIIAFLANVTDSQTLEGIISGINTTIANNLSTAETYTDNAVSTHNQSGTAHSDLRTLIATKVDTVSGKGLSTNDYTNTDKSQVAQNKDTNSVQDTVVAEALAKLNQEFEAFKKMLQSGNIGDIHVTSVNTDSVPMYCGQQMIIKGSGSPVTNSIIPDFEGQIYIDTTNRNAYMCCDSSSASYWKLLN